ncbi:MAG: hypothetical protein ACTSXD_03615, partial [Candidatus Heimdallarchaeaceae archaeon]
EENMKAQNPNIQIFEEIREMKTKDWNWKRISQYWAYRMWQIGAELRYDKNGNVIEAVFKNPVYEDMEFIKRFLAKCDFLNEKD